MLLAHSSDGTSLSIGLKLHYAMLQLLVRPSKEKLLTPNIARNHIRITRSNINKTMRGTRNQRVVFQLMSHKHQRMPKIDWTSLCEASLCVQLQTDMRSYIYQLLN